MGISVTQKTKNVLRDWKFFTVPEAIREIRCGLKVLNLRTKY